MDLSLNLDQIAILDALDGMVRPYAAMPIGATGFVLTSADLDREIGESGFLDVGRDPDLRAVTAALVVERLARLPFATEPAIRALVGPPLGDGTTGPLCVVEAGQDQRPLRFLAEGTLLVDPATIAGTRHDVSPDQICTHWRIALAAEAAGLLAAAQVRTNGVRWLALKAAATLDAGDAALALLRAQEAARAVTYDLHEFLGAMGMTLEHPLNLWTYRLKALIGELGGRAEQATAAADAIWG